MTLKRVILAVLVVGMAIAPVAHAQDVPTCADEHVTGADCQGADLVPSANECRIKVWVGKASCDLIVPDDAKGSVGIGASAWADQGTAPEMDLVVRDKATGTVLSHSHHKADPAQVDPSTVIATVAQAVDDVVGTRFFGMLFTVGGLVARDTHTGNAGLLNLPPAGAEVTCEVTGTHSVLGAATAAAGDTPNVDYGGASVGLPSGNPNILYNNDFGCIVQREAASDPPPIEPGTHGCVAQNAGPDTGYVGSSCGFFGEPSGVPSGVVSATTGSWTVSHQGPSGTVVDISGSGPGAMPYVFTRGVRYRLTVNGDGVGAVTAGSPE